MEEMEMTVYEPDTSASAVILCRYGRFDGQNFQFTRIERYKVLKKDGVDHAKFVFPGGNDVTIRGRTYNLIDGKIEEEKLKRESIFKERVTDDYYRYRIALPNVKVGSVFEVEYSYQSFPAEWRFQELIPIKWCELRIEESNYINFRKKMVGYEPLSSAENNCFVAKDMPAFKDEAYMSSRENFITKFEFDLLSITIPERGIYESFTTTWEAVNDKLLEDEKFGDVIRGGSGYLSDIAKEIEASGQSDLEKVKAAYNALKHIEWDDYLSIYSSNTMLSPVYKKGIGNSADLNFMLLQLLNKIDIEAYPVVLSTRKNGLLNPFYPSKEKLNYCIVCALVDDKEYLMDATASLMPFGMLPVRCLNEQGRLVNKQSGKWIPIKPDKKDKETIYYELSLSNDLQLSGKLSYNRYDYAAYDFRNDQKDFSGEEEYIIDLEERFPGLTVKEMNISNLDEIEQPITDTYTVSIKNQVEQINDMLLINPFLFETREDNPFKLEKRNYPVDFVYQRQKQLITKISIPEGYTVSEVPQPIRINMPGKSAAVQIMYQVNGNAITMMYKFNINKTLFLPEEYANLKTLYAEIIKKHAEPIILKANKDEASL
jgi:hypothetical protein